MERKSHDFRNGTFPSLRGTLFATRKKTVESRPQESGAVRADSTFCCSTLSCSIGFQPMGVGAATDVDEALSAACDAYHIEEIERRTVHALGTRFFRPSRPSATVAQMAATFVAETQILFSTDRINAAIAKATGNVEQFKHDRKRHENFYGKEILKMFWSTHLRATPLLSSVFTYEAARHARKRKCVKNFFDQFFDDLIPGWRLESETSLQK